jgi:hypothetical protein
MAVPRVEYGDGDAARRLVPEQVMRCGNVEEWLKLW